MLFSGKKAAGINTNKCLYFYNCKMLLFVRLFLCFFDYFCFFTCIVSFLKYINPTLHEVFISEWTRYQEGGIGRFFCV